jgi:membrane-bound serine protease (ClpP class)
VTEAASIPEEEAKRYKVIDLIATDMGDLLRQIDGRKVTLKNGAVLTLHTKNAPTQEIPKTWREALLTFLAHPNVFYILMLLGVYGLLFELQNPGATLPGWWALSHCCSRSMPVRCYR